jgi:hypothetical protein
VRYQCEGRDSTFNIRYVLLKCHNIVVMIGRGDESLLLLSELGQRYDHKVQVAALSDALNVHDRLNRDFDKPAVDRPAHQGFAR